MNVRTRVTAQDIAFVLGILVLAGLGLYQYLSHAPAVKEAASDVGIILVLGAIVANSIMYVGWRRIRSQEREISRRVKTERRAHELSHADPLTGLANRREFDLMLRAACALPCGAHEVHVVMMLDLNGFKQINELYGHAEGDDLLVALAGRVRSVTREYDLIARIHGDTFGVIAYYVAGPEGALNIAARVMWALDAPVRIDSRHHKLSVAIGIAMIPRDGKSAEEIMRNAELALYRAKGEAVSTVRFFEQDMDQKLRERAVIERELSVAIGTDSLRPWYQPIVDLTNGEILAFEALARWNHDTLGEFPPERFIPIAETSGHIRPLADWLLRCSVTDAMTWPNGVKLSFNIAPAQLREKTLGMRILRLLGETGLSPSRLELEISESALVHDVDISEKLLASLSEAGVGITVGDFGTGNSSLYHLRHLKIGKVKIDRTLVSGMMSKPDNAAVVRALAGFANGLGLKVAAEGIETSEERDALLREGCREGQGFLFSRAVPLTKTAELISGGSIKNVQSSRRLA